MNTLTAVVIAIPLLALSIAFHEMTHALVSDALGDDTARLKGRITLNPFAHINLFSTVLLPLLLILAGLPPFGAAQPVPFNPSRLKFGEFGVALVAVAGPLSNLLLAIVMAFFLRSVPGVGLLHDILDLGLQLNVAFFVFNPIPFPPLDGSRVLYAFAPEPLQNLMEQIERLGFTAILLFMFLLFPMISPLFSRLTEASLQFLG